MLFDSKRTMSESENGQTFINLLIIGILNRKNPYKIVLDISG